MRAGPAKGKGLLTVRTRDLGQGQMAERIRGRDWTDHPLGPVETWSETLRTSVSLCVHSRFPTALWWGLDLVALYNDGYADYLGPEKHPQALGRPYREVWGELWEEVEELFDAVFREKQATWQEDQRFTVYRRGYAEEAFFTYNLSPVVEEDGTVGGALNVVVETTSAVLARRRMHALQRASAASAGAGTVDAAGAAIGRELARHNSDLPFVVLYRVKEDEARLIGTSALVPGSEPAPERLSLADERWPLGSVLESAEPVHVEAAEERFADLPGGPWPEGAREALVLPLERRGFRGALIAGVSPRRALDRDYRAFLVSLGQTVAAALGDVAAQERERSARLEAEEANRAKGEFVAAVSHDLRTPLNAIAGYADLLRSGVYGEVSDRQGEALEKIRRSQKHLLALINDVLLFARAEAAELEIRRDELEARAVLGTLETLVHPQAVANGITLELVECEAPYRFRGDEERVRQILLNLTGNALKFTPAGGEVTVACVLSGDGHEVEFRVADTGPGIPPEDQEAIFDPFTQMDRRIDHPQEGSGLGLSISRKLARSMDGDVTVESEAGRGATFRLSLPRIRREGG